MNLSLRQLKAFLAVARLKNFTRAAENQHITQQGLSLLIQQMEKQLGSRLFDRTTRSITLSPAGRHLLGVAEEVVARLESTALSIEQMSRHTAHRISVAATPLVASHVMPEVYRRFTQRNPEVRVRVVDTDRNHIQPLVESGEVDFGLGIFFKPVSGLHRRRIFECEMLCLEASETPGQQAAPPLRWAELEGAPLIGLPTENPVQQLVDMHLSRVAQISPERPIYNHIPTILSMVEQGFGVSVLPSFTLAAIDQRGLRARQLRDPTVPVSFYQLTAKGRSRPQAEPDFLHTLLEVLRERCTVR